MVNKCDFFIVGAPKCGTTSLNRYLGLHPSLCLSNPKEVNYFSASDIKAQGLYYKEKLIEDAESYAGCFSHSREGDLLGEGSVSYLYYKAVPGNIYDYNPCAKIIIILRDPVDRAFSHYLMDRRLGYVSESFSNIFSNSTKYPVHYQQYFSLGKYFEQVKRYVDFFGRDQVFIINDVDLKCSTVQVLRGVCGFLGVEFCEEMYTEKSHNEYKVPRNFIVSKLYESYFLRSAVQRLIPKVMQDKVKSILFSSGGKPVLGSELNRKLNAYFEEDRKLLAKLISDDFPLRWGG